MTTVCESNKIDSNITGLRIAQEVCLKQLPTLAADGHDPTWIPFEPDKYSDTGAKVTTTSRNPINPSRQNRKGVVTALEAKAGFSTDLTQNNLTWLMQGILFAQAREKVTTAGINAVTPTPITAVVAASKEYTVATTGFIAGNIILAKGFTNLANNGLKTIVSDTAGEAVVNEVLVDEAAPPATASLKVVGQKFDSGDASITLNGNIPQLATTAFDLTTLNLVPGEWVFLGGDAAGTSFATNKGFARIASIAAHLIVFDKVGWSAAPVAEAGAGLTVEMFFGTVIKNEEDPNLIKRYSYQVERTLGSDADGTQSQYITGAVADEFKVDIKQESKVTADITFIAADQESRTGAVGLKTGTRPSLVSEDAFNTSSDFNRIAMAIIDPTTSQPIPLVSFATDFSLDIKNNVTQAKAIGVLGGFDVVVGTFDVKGTLTGYYQDTRALDAVRNNPDVTLDMVVAKNNAGMVLDIPLLSLGNGLPAVQQNQAITIPLDATAAQSNFGHTLMYVNFPYLPDLAM